ncbi:MULTISPECIES: hypothetical protein [unclassified Pseudomonas]|uniref:hypothetical protein n=1 Tax=unclassified Pseudomonas TaxID=196821 RepID=UPI0015A2EEC3|nr:MULTISPECIES: hypothetical protein [unclassified Pseudomonas]NWC93638.1 hypothetical protein [Pseudomonas sp. IPO3779]NWD18395.1 hypothetical protein [Pseudomonas sp. IPO3778]
MAHQNPRPPGSSPLSNGEEMNVKAMQAALDQANKGCKKVGESQDKLDAGQQKQQAMADSNDTVSALGGLFKSAETSGKKPRGCGAFLCPPG